MAATALVLVLAASCGDFDYDASGAAGRHEDFFDASGAASAPAATVVVGIDWPFDPVLLYEASKETAYADNDPVTTPEQWGSNSDVVITQGTGSAKPTYQSPCDVGPAVPCFYFDGGDHWIDASARASMTFLADGTGVTCYAVVEFSAATADATIFGTGAWSALDGVGAMSYYSAASTDRYVLYVANGASMIVNGRPTGGTYGDDRTAAQVFTHGTARALDALVDWYGGSSAATGGEGDYGAAPSTSNPPFPLTVGKRPGGSPGGQLTGYVFAIACDDAVHDAGTIAATITAIEAVTGALPQ